MAIVAVCVVVVAALGATIGVLAARSSDGRASGRDTSSPRFDDAGDRSRSDRRDADPAIPSTSRTAPSTTTTTSPPTTTDPSAGAAGTLAQIRATDRSQVELLTDRWVPQISSKRVGLRADGIVYGPVDILNKHRQLQADFAYDGVGLLWSGDYSTFKDGTFWVSIALAGYPTADGAIAWCERAGLGPDDCFAKLISHSASSTGSTKNR